VSGSPSCGTPIDSSTIGRSTRSFQRMIDDVGWPDVANSAALHGKQAIRSYWHAQFATADPHGDPLTSSRRATTSSSPSISASPTSKADRPRYRRWCFTATRSAAISSVGWSCSRIATLQSPSLRAVPLTCRLGTHRTTRQNARPPAGTALAPGDLPELDRRAVRSRIGDLAPCGAPYRSHGAWRRHPSRSVPPPAPQRSIGASLDVVD
jgi:hypothetical protein